MRKLLRTIRFDDSDTRVFDLAAEAGEWAVSGAFQFGAVEPQDMKGKLKQAFANGFLGIQSFGRSTFATVGEVSDAELAEIERRLAEHFVFRYGAPSIAAAMPVADDEIAFALDLCRDTPINTVFAVRRSHDEKGGIKEEFRRIAAPTGERNHARIWTTEWDT